MLGLGTSSGETTEVRSSALRPPAVIAERYELRRFLGRGASKEVYLAHDARLDREVAVSLIETAALGPAARERVRRELRLVGRLGDHPNIVPVHDAGEEQGLTWIVARFMAGGSVAGLLDAAPGHRLDVPRAVRIAADVARALAHAHDRGVLHRDAKPANVWLAGDGTAMLGDFGTALTSSGSRLTASGVVVGTAAYLAPEQATGAEADQRSDLYALGATLYELLCGRPPFVGDDPVAVISQHVWAAPVAPSWHNPDVPEALAALVLRLLAKAPSDRPQSAGQVAEALERIGAAPAEETHDQDSTANPLDGLARAAFVARDRELSQLRGELEAALTGRTRVSLVAGEAGIGKTRLVEELATYARLRGAAVLWGRCHEGEGAPAYWPWVQIIRAYLGGRDSQAIADELGPIALDVARVVPGLGAAILPAPSPELSPEQARFQLFDAIAGVARKAAAERPLLIVLDDLHRADRPSLLLLEFLADALADAPVLLLGTYRDAELGRGHPLKRVLSARVRRRLGVCVQLAGLDQEAMTRFIELTTGSEPDDALVRAIVEQTEGNPLFVTEIVRLLASEGRLQSPGGARLPLPHGVRDVIAARLDWLSDDCVRALAVASIAGREFRLLTVERAGDVTGERLLEVLEEATAARLVVEVPGAAGRFRFFHAVVRDAIQAELRPGERRRLHRRVGLALECLYADDPEPHLAELAHHFEQAAPLGEAERALEYLERAAARADAQLAYEEAAGYYERALELLDLAGGGRPRRRVELLLAAGQSHERAGDTVRMKRAFRAAAALASRHGLQAELALAALGYGRAPRQAGVGDRFVVDLLERALAALADQFAPLRARLLARLAVELFDTTERGRAEELSREAVAVARRTGDEAVVASALASSRWTLWRPGTAEERRGLSTESLRLAQRARDPQRTLAARGFLCYDLLELGDVAAADAELDAYARLAADLREPYHEGHALAMEAMRALLGGRYELAEPLVSRAHALLVRAQEPDADEILVLQRFTLRRDQGRLSDVEKEVHQLNGRSPAVPAWEALEALLECERRRDRAARPIFDRLAADRFGSLPEDLRWGIAMAALADSCAHLDDPHSAEVLSELLAPHAGCAVSCVGTVCWGSVERSLGLLAAITGNAERAIAHLRTACERHRKMAARPWLARSRYELAAVLEPRHAEEAGRLRGEALALARKLGMGDVGQRWAPLGKSLAEAVRRT